jgi:hypothetical protein
LPPPTDDGDPQLWERLQELSGQAVADASVKSAGFTEDEEAMHKRYSKALSRRTFSKIRTIFYWFLLVCVCVVLTICAVAYLYLVWLWLSTIIYGAKLHDAAGLKTFIDGVLWSILIIFATLFFEGAFKERDS